MPPTQVSTEKKHLLLKNGRLWKQKRSGLHTLSKRAILIKSGENRAQAKKGSASELDSLTGIHQERNKKKKPAAGWNLKEESKTFSVGGKTERECSGGSEEP